MIYMIFMLLERRLSETKSLFSIHSLGSSGISSVAVPVIIEVIVSEILRPAILPILRPTILPILRPTILPLTSLTTSFTISMLCFIIYSSFANIATFITTIVFGFETRQLAEQSSKPAIDTTTLKGHPESRKRNPYRSIF